MIAFVSTRYRVWSRDALGGPWKLVGKPIDGLRDTLRMIEGVQALFPHRIYLAFEDGTDPNGEVT